MIGHRSTVKSSSPSSTNGTVGSSQCSMGAAPPGLTPGKYCIYSVYMRLDWDAHNRKKVGAHGVTTREFGKSRHTNPERRENNGKKSSPEEAVRNPGQGAEVQIRVRRSRLVVRQSGSR